MENIILGIDIGGTGIKGALVDIDKGMLVSERIKIGTPQPAVPEAVTATIKELIDILDWKGKPTGIGFPTLVDKGVCLTANNIDKSWIGINLEQYFTTALETEISILNDADAAGLSEVHYGAGKDQDGLVVLLTIGTGIGSAMIFNQQIIPSVELGSLQWKNGGIAEHYVSNKARKVGELSWKKWGTELGDYLNHVTHLFSPNMIILGGGVSKKLEKFSPYFNIERNIPVVAAKHLNDAGIMGAALNRVL